MKERFGEKDPDSFFFLDTLDIEAALSLDSLAFNWKAWRLESDLPDLMLPLCSILSMLIDPRVWLILFEPE